MSNLEALIRVYVELVILWSKNSGGDNLYRVNTALRFFEKLIRKELEK